MSNTCRSCGGFLRYDIPTGMLKCDSCDSSFPVESYTAATDAEEHQKNSGKYEVTVYTCPNCGAEISSTESTALDYCLYCGSFVTLDSQLSKLRMPDTIIPFSKTKDECKRAYRRAVSRKLYAPKEFRSDEFLDGFKGIYIPYWSYSYDLGPTYTLPGSDSHQKGDYKITQHYNIYCTGDVHLEGPNYDASSTFDDSISARVARLDASRAKPFHPGYLFGFFGDTADVESSVYREDADTAAGPVLWEQANDDSRTRSGHPTEPPEEKIVSALHASRSSRLTMLPVWFLTWRKKDKLAYSVMNGDTGEIYSEIPVDPKRYLLLSLLTAVPFFFLLNLLITFDAASLLLLAMVLAVVFITLYSTEVEQIVRRTLHVDDKGYLVKHAAEAENTKENYHSNLLSGALSWLVDFFFRSGATGYILLAVAIIFFSGFVGAGVAAIAVAAPIYSIYRVHKNGKLLGQPHLIRDIYSSIFALLLCAAIFFLDPAADMFYYATAIVCMLAVAFTAVRIMLRYNEVITRPVPHFFDREEGKS